MGKNNRRLNSPSRSAHYSVIVLMFQVDRYKMSIVEKGTPYTEQIEVDEKQDVEIFRVPGHNDVDGADFLHDFKMVRLVWTFRAGYRFACDATVTQGCSRGTYKARLSFRARRWYYTEGGVTLKTRQMFSFRNTPEELRNAT